MSSIAPPSHTSGIHTTDDWITPKWLIDRLGPFAIHVGIMLQIGFLLALLVETVVARGLVVKVGCVVLATAVFSNRLTVLLCNLTLLLAYFSGYRAMFALRSAPRLPGGTDAPSARPAEALP